MWFCRYLLPLFLFASVSAEPISVAVASNFTVPVTELAASFQESTGHQVRVSAASTGMLYAGISNGASYAVFLAADEERPRLLEESGLGVEGTRFTYAVGRLELWSADPEFEGADCRAQLESLGARHLAIANPVTAPYGAAARSFLQEAGLWETIEGNLVFGQNIAQALQFVATGNASLGLIASSQAQSDRLPHASCRWQVPDSMHAPLEQQAILLDRARENEAARSFLAFLKSPEGRAIIQSHGYEVVN